MSRNDLDVCLWLRFQSYTAVHLGNVQEIILDLDFEVFMVITVVIAAA
jgi:hypothetical protein